MPVLQVLALVISLSIAVVGTTLFVRAIRQILATLRIGQPAHRTDNLPARSLTMVRETLGHTRMLQWSWVGAGHWFVMTGFGLLFFTLVTAFGQLFSPTFHIPFLGHFFLFEWATELFTWVMLVAIVSFIYYRATRPKERVRGPRGRFWGSTMWQGYFVEMVILGVGVCIVLLRGLEYAIATYDDPGYASALHFPLTFWLGEAFSGISEDGLANLIWVVATLKIVISFAWMITISLQPSMGVAWHRFLAFFNIFFKRKATGGTALGGLAPMTSGGKAIDFEDLEDMDEDTKLGVGAVEDFAWKGILDFSTCTECGRCQSQCPAWNTDKPLSPKLLITALRDHAYAKAPYVQAAEGDRAALVEGDTALALEAERPLVGDTGDDWFYMPDSGAAVIDSEVLWNCTSCGACVQQCPVDIEHVDHIVDMRRYQVLIESNFPTELNGLFKGLENKGNPWNMSPQARLDWAKDLPFEVKVVGEDVESLDEVEWLFWVGCAGAYEDRAKKTTRAVAELLDMAGVDFAVLGNGETCTGDPARRAGNEFVFQGLATQNAEVLKETRAKKVVSTCAHCFNTLKNEYAAFGVELEVVHHTQLLNRLVREKKLTPVATNGGPKRSVTYHDPCYIGRHNGVYSPPRELLNVIPDAELKEMPRNSERSFCCGAGGARMWMEENTGERINLNRTQEAIDTGADQIAVGCPFCRVMLSDGLTMKQSEGAAREEVEVLDVAQMLLASVKGETAAPAKATAKAGSKGAAGAAAGAAAATATADADALKAEPSAGDATQTADTVTDTEDVGPLAKASGGSSLFDDAEPSDSATAGGSLFDDAGDSGDSGDSGATTSLFEGAGDEAAEPKDSSPASSPASGGSLFDDEPAEQSQPEAASSGGSLFDLGGDDGGDNEAPASPAAPATTSTEEAAPAAGGSLFDLGDDGDDEAAAVATPAATESTETEPTATAGGSLFDVDDDGDTAAEPSAQDRSPAAAATMATTASTPATEIPEGGSLFDLEAEETQVAAPASTTPTEPRTDDVGETVDRSHDAADTEVAPDQDQTDPEPTPEPAATDQPTATASTTARTAVSPATEIPEGGSLFDLEAEETQVAAPASTTPTEPRTDDVGETVDRSHDAADTGGATDTTTDTTGTEAAPSTRSLFDVPVEEAAPAPAAEHDADREPVAAEEPTTEEPTTEEPTTEAADSAAPVRSLREIKEQFAGGDAPTAPESSEPEQTAGAAQTAEADEPPAEQEQDERSEDQDDQARPASSGPAHQPRTDTDIDESGSLFDL